jgi:hypothetical protein
MKTLIYIGGMYHVGFAVFHLLFWKLFDWKNDLSSLSFINRNVMQILNLRLIFVFLIFAYISVFHAGDLLTTSMGKVLLFAIALCWFGRAIEQIIFFGLRNKISISMFALFLIGAAIYIYPFLQAIEILN